MSWIFGKNTIIKVLLSYQATSQSDTISEIINCTRYHCLVRKLIYLNIGLFCLYQVSSCKNQSNIIEKSTLKILRYIKGALKKKLLLYNKHQNIKVEAYNDVDYVAILMIDDQFQAFAVILSANCLVEKSKNLSVIAQFSCES